MTQEELYMQRAFQLAEHGRGTVSPNPMVGCVLVTDGRIVGEGWHQHYGGPHAEAHAVRDAIRRGNESLLSEVTAYVTLEPCSHFGKTPPCAGLLIEKKIKRVVIANDDPNPLVAGRGIATLREAGIKVESGLLTTFGTKLNARFFTYFAKKRPYVILKWAETADGFIAKEDGSPIQISNIYSSTRVHRWRSEEDAILVGRQTALTDNPRLNVRLWNGHDPVRVVLDRSLSLPSSLHIYDQSQPTIVYNYEQQNGIGEVPERYAVNHAVSYDILKKNNDELNQVLTDLHNRKIQSVLVEGGAQVLQAFIQAGLWDEIRRCQGKDLLGSGIKAPTVAGALTHSEIVEGDYWTFYENVQSQVGLHRLPLSPDLL
jgi:diaminohydroxyphosphoribosylaminopyrimidine deaminase/5-amino-6-(5-phosphoribosylamino)uracil reductase